MLELLLVLLVVVCMVAVILASSKANVRNKYAVIGQALDNDMSRKKFDDHYDFGQRDLEQNKEEAQS